MGYSCNAFSHSVVKQRLCYAADGSTSLIKRLLCMIWDVAPLIISVYFFVLSVNALRFRLESGSNTVSCVTFLLQIMNECGFVKRLTQLRISGLAWLPLLRPCLCSEYTVHRSTAVGGCWGRGELAVLFAELTASYAWLVCNIYVV